MYFNFIVILLLPSLILLLFFFFWSSTFSTKCTPPFQTLDPPLDNTKYFKMNIWPQKKGVAKHRFMKRRESRNTRSVLVLWWAFLNQYLQAAFLCDIHWYVNSIVLTIQCYQTIIYISLIKIQFTNFYRIWKVILLNSFSNWLTIFYYITNWYLRIQI